ncbi:MAG: TlpA disulfide reductase family protein [Candidatus Solibacter sp.]|nr:TlpA disulfide reductase family protein [Candidatus Solibacter sp.]
MRFFRVISVLTLLALAVASARAAVLPRPSPDFAINLGQGKQARISQYKGKTVVIAFILTYCSHCQKAIGVLSRMQQEYGARGLQVLASATEDMAAAALPGFLRQFEPPFPVGVNTTDEFVTYMQHPTMLQLYMPGLVFIDRDGFIQAQCEGRDAFLEATSMEKNIRAKVEEMLKTPDAAPKKTGARKGYTKRSN